MIKTVNVIFFTLGIDSEGHAANFVETEQIVHYGGSKASFVQASWTLGGGQPARLFARAETSLFAPPS